jgi:hypothetical protein
MARGATADWQHSFSVSMIQFFFDRLTQPASSDSFYKNIVLYMTQFWVSLSRVIIVAPILIDP